MGGGHARERASRMFLAVGALAIAAFLFCPPVSLADTIVRGQVKDLVTDTPVLGVRVAVYKGSALLGQASSDADGHFQIPVDVGTGPASQTLSLVAEHADFAAATLNFGVAAGTTDAAYLLELFPVALSDCRVPRGHGVIVGHFRSSLGQRDVDLAYRIVDALTYSLLTSLQQVHVTTPLQPDFWACGDAQPRAPTLGQHYAKALGADAFVTGDVKLADGVYDVRTYVSDRFGLFVPPHSTMNERVDLEDPGAAELHPTTHAAILTAVAAAYEDAGRYAEGVDATVAAEHIQGSLTPSLEAIRDRCQAQLENRGLIREGPQ